MYWTVHVKDVVKVSPQSSIFPAQRCDLKPILRATACGLHIDLERNTEDSAKNKKFSKDARFDTVCTTTSENIDRSHRRMQHESFTGLEHISMVKNYVAGWSSSKIDQDESSCVLRLYIVCESQIQIFLIIGQQHWRMSGPNMDSSKQMHWQSKKCDSFGVNYQVLLLFNSTRHFQEHFNGQTPDSFDESIIFMSMFNDIEWTKNDNADICLRSAKEVVTFAAHFKPRRWCFLESASRRGGTTIQFFKEHEILSHR